MFNVSQTYSGSYNFSPSSAEIILNAFNRIGMAPTDVTTTQITQAIMELNLVLVRFNAIQPNLWTVDLQGLPMIQGQATYSLPAETIEITNAFIRTGIGQSQIDRMIYPMSQTEYAGLSNKRVQGVPTQFWFDKLISPTITFYLTPDGEGPYTCMYYRVRRIQDATAQYGYNVEVPALWLDALVAGLSHRLARIYKPELEQMRKADADEAWTYAANQDVENVPLYIAPSIGGYFKR